MLKKSVLTPALSGVLAVAVVGSGVGYYNVFVKDKGDAGEEAKKSGKNSKTAVLTVDEAAKTLGTTLDKAQQVAKGETDTGCKATISYAAPTDGEIGQLGLKEISMSAEAKQKDKMSGMDYTISYGGTGLLTLNVVYDNNNETAYVRVPELSDAYLTGTAADIEKLVGSSLGAYTSAAGIGGSQDTPDLSALENYDFSALIEDLMTYGDTVKDNLPAPTDGEAYKVEKDGVSIELTTKSYTVTSADAKKVAEAIVEKGKNDSALKDFMSQVGMDDSEYASMWDELNVDDVDSEDKSVTVDLYYTGDDVCGFKASTSDGEDFHMIVASDAKNIIVDCDMSSVDDSTFVMSGLLTYTDDTLDGSINVDADDDGEKISMVMNYNSIKITEDSASGSINVTASKGGESVMDMTCTLDVSGNTGTVSYTGNVEGQNIGTLTVSVEETNASDITVPTGTMYNFGNEEELQKYAESCDTEGWMNTIKSALGDELYSQIFGSTASVYDNNTKYDDNDFSSSDFSEYDFGSESSSSQVTA